MAQDLDTMLQLMQLQQKPSPYNSNWMPQMGQDIFQSSVGGALNAYNMMPQLGLALSSPNGPFGATANANADRSTSRYLSDSPVRTETVRQGGMTDRFGMLEPLFGSVFGSGSGSGGGGFSTNYGASITPGQYNTGISPYPGIEGERASGIDLMKQTTAHTMPTPGGVGLTPGSNQALQTHLGQMLSSGSQANQSAFDRFASEANATQDLASQTARAKAGLGGGDLLSRMRQIPLREGVAKKTAALGMAGSMV